MQQRRPGFPARILPSAPGVGKPVAAPAVRTGLPQAVAMPTGLGLDSAAVRARMVQRLGAAGMAVRLITADRSGALRGARVGVLAKPIAPEELAAFLRDG